MCSRNQQHGMHDFGKSDGKSNIHFKGNLTSKRYLIEARQPTLIPLMNMQNHLMTLTYARYCTSTPCLCHQRRFIGKNVPIFGPSPAKPPEMNPIQNLWLQLERVLTIIPTNEGKIAQGSSRRSSRANMKMMNVRALNYVLAATKALHI